MELLESTRSYHGKAREGLYAAGPPCRNCSSHLLERETLVGSSQPSGSALRRSQRRERYIFLVGNLRLLQHAVSSVCHFHRAFNDNETSSSLHCSLRRIGIDYMFGVRFQDLTRTYFSFNFSEISSHRARDAQQVFADNHHGGRKRSSMSKREIGTWTMFFTICLVSLACF